MPESGQNQNFYNIVVDFVDQSVLVCDPSGINCSVITFERFNLSGACFWRSFRSFLASDEKTILYSILKIYSDNNLER